ncbi:MAG: (d)CMP kinase [Pseudomonadota bacterium]
MKFTVAIDGPAAAGKGTIARAVAKAFDFEHLDTGLLYRAVGVKTLARGRGVIDPIAAEKLAETLTPGDLARGDLRSAVASRAASKVAAMPAVREALLNFQRKFARRSGGAVLDGRDIGTVICPEAEVKLFVTASELRRAERRFAELTASGAETSLEKVRADLQARDARDAARDTAPMVQAADALLLDTTELSIDAAVAEATALIKQKMGQGRD